MAEVKSWRDYAGQGTSTKQKKKESTSSWRDYADKSSAESDSASVNWRDPNSIASIIGGNITKRVNGWLKDHNGLVSDYQKRYEGRKFSYEDDYVSDSADWLAQVTERKKKAYEDADAILSYMDQYEDYLDEKWVKEVRQVILNVKGTQDQILNAASEDNEWWSGFGSDQELLDKFGSSEDVYNYFQKEAKYRKLYKGMTYAEVYEFIADTEAGAADGTSRALSEEDKEWLINYAESVKTLEDWDNEIAAYEGDLAQLEDLLGEYKYYEQEAKVLAPSSPESQYATKRMAEISSQFGYEGIKGIETAISQKKEKVNSSKNTRELTAMSAVTGNADFAENSQYDSTRTDVAMEDAMWGFGNTQYDTSKLFGDFLYDYINGNQDALDAAMVNDTATNAYFFGFDKGFLKTMSKDEIGVYNYLYKTQSKDAANVYLSLLQNDLEGRRKIQEQEKWAGYAKADPVGSSVFSVLVSPLKGISYLGQVGDMMEDGKLDQNAGYNRFSYIPTTIRAQVSQTIENSGNWGKVGSFAYNTGMSMGDFLFTTAISGGNQALALSVMGSGAAADMTISAKERGLDDGQAFALGTIAGIAEAAMEKISLGAWLEGDMTEGALRYLLKNAFAEAGEEAGTSAINLLADVMIAGDKSEWNKAMQAYIKEGKTEAEAFGLVAAEQAAQIGLDALGGFLSGAAISGGTYAGASIGAQVKYGDISKDKVASQKLVAEGIELNPDNLYVLKMQAKLDSGKNLTGLQVRNVLAANQEKITSNDIQKIQKAAEMRLTELGQTEDVSKLAEIATKWATGQDITRAEKSFLANSQYGSRVANELLPKNIETGGYTSEWAENIGTRQVNREAYNKELFDKWRAAVDEIAKGSDPATYKALDERLDDEDKLSVSESGTATISRSGKEIDLSKAEIVDFVKDKKTGKVTDMILDVGGEKVKVSEIDYADADQSYLFSAVKHIENITPGDATAFVRGYDPSAGLGVGAYLNGIDEAFTYGYHNYSEADMQAGNFTADLSKEQAKGAYMLGQTAKNASKTAKTDAIKRMRTAVEAEAEKAKVEGKEAPKAKKMTITYNAGNGKIVDFDKASLKLTDNQKSAPALAKVFHEMGLGTNFELFASYVNKDGVRVFLDENGVEQKAPSGVYRMKDGTVRIDLNAYNGRGLTLDVMAHELTHFIQQWSDTKYQALAEFLVKTYEKTDMSMHERVLREQTRLEGVRGEDVSYNEAFDEVVANAMSKMLADGKVMERLNELKAQDADLARKLWAGLKKLLNKFFRVAQKQSALFHDTADLMELKAEFKQMQQMWAEAFVEASENYQASLTVAENQTFAEAGKGVNGQQSSQETDIDTDADSVYDSAKEEPVYAHHQPGQDMQEFDRKLWTRKKTDAIQKYDLTEEEAECIDAYVGGEVYNWNKALLSDPSVERTEYIDYLVNQTINGLIKLPSFAGRTYRNLSFADQNSLNSFLAKHKAGKNVVMEAFASASKDPNGYTAPGDYVVHMVIDGFSSRDISDSFAFPWQREVIYLPGTEVHITRETIANDGYPLIYAQEVKKNGKDVEANHDGVREGSAEPNQKGQAGDAARKGNDLGRVYRDGRVDGNGNAGNARQIQHSGDSSRYGEVKGDVYSSQETDLDSKSHPYSYDTLISKPDMAVTTVDSNVPKSRADVVYQAKQNAAKVGKLDPKTGSVSVYVDDVGAEVVLGRDGLKHSLDRRLSVNAPVVLKAGEILQKSIRINETTPQKAEAAQSYVLIGTAMSENGELYIVRSVINRFSNELASIDVLYAINAKKESAALLPLFTDKSALGTDSTISIAVLLDLVNQYFPDILPEDVLRHYGYDARPEGDLGKDALYSTHETDYSNRDLLANAFEGITKSSIEYETIQEYKNRIKLLNEQEEKLDKLNAEIRRIRFTAGEYDAQKLRELEAEAKNVAKNINRHDKKLLSLEASEPLRKVIEQERKKAAQKTREHVKEIQQNRKVRTEQTEYRHKIRKVIRDLDKLLNRGNKKLNVKEDMQNVVTKALQAADILFTDNYGTYDMLRNGVSADLSDSEEALVNTCTKMLKDLDKMPTDGYENWQARQEVENKLRTKMSKLNEVFARERKRLNNTTVSSILDELADAYASLEKSEQSYVQGAYSEPVHNFLKSLQSEVRGTIVKDMTKDQLESVYAAYKMVLNTIRNANKTFNEELKQSREQLGNAVIEEVLKAGGAHLLGTKLGDAISQFDWNNMKPIWLANRIKSETFGKLMNGLFKGQYSFAVDIDEVKQFKLSMDEKYHPRNWDAEKLYEFESSTGKKFGLNLQQIMSLYAFSKREQAYSHLLNGGFVFEDNSTVVVDGKLGIKRTYIQKGATSYKLNEATLNGIINSLTAEQKAYVDEMQKYLSDVMGAKGNEVSMQLYGIQMFKEKFYFPLRSSGAYMERAKEAEMKKQQGQINLVNYGFTHAIKPEAKNPIVLSGFMDVWAEHCNEMSMYHSVVLPMEDFRKVYNYSTIHDEKMESASVFQTIQDAYGKEATSYIDQLYRELNAGATVDPRETPYKKLISNFKKAAVMLSGSVVVQQFSSIGRAYAVIDPKYFVGKKINSDTNLSTVEEMKKYAPVAIIKEMGGFDTGTKGNAKAYIMAEQYGKGERFKGFVKDKQYRGDLMGYLPAKADELTWCAIWEAVKRETKAKNPNMDAKSEEFLKLAGERFSEVIEKTQVYDSVLARSANMRSKSGLMQMATAFMAESTTTVNLLEDAIRSGKAKNIARAFGSVAVSIVLNNALASIVYAMRDDDEDETFLEKYFQAFTSGMIDDINPMSYYPFLKDVYALFQGYDVERADMSVIADVRDALKRVVSLLGKDTSEMDDNELAEHYKMVNEVIMGLLDAGCSMFGVPVKNVRRDAMGIINAWNTISTDLSDERDNSWRSFWDKVGSAAKDTIPIYAWTKDEAKTDKLYDAIISGDKVYLGRLKSTYKTDSAYQSAVRKALRENDPRIHDAAQARYNGNTEEYKRIFREIQQEGNFSFDDIMSAINSEENTIKGKLEPEKATSSYTASDFVESIVLGDAKSAQTIKEDIISTKVTNGKPQEEAEKEFLSNVTTSIRDAYASGLLDQAGAEKMLIEYADKDEEEAVSKVRYWAFCEEHPKCDFTEANVNDYVEFAEPADIPLDVFVQYINRTKGLAEKKDEWGDVEVTKREQVLAVIDSLPLTWKQKDALYLAAGYSENKIWDVPW